MVFGMALFSGWEFMIPLSVRHQFTIDSDQTGFLIMLMV